MALPVDQIRRIAALELNALRAVEVLSDEYERAAIPARGTPIHDLNGTVLFHRLPLAKGQALRGYADIAVDEAMGEPFLATSMGAVWDEKALLEAGTARARKRRPSLKFDTVRFVTYSYPKIALQFLSAGSETLMLELFTWAEVPSQETRDPNFMRWSYLDNMPPELRRSRLLSFKKRLQAWDVPVLKKFDFRYIAREPFLEIPRVAIKLVDTREVHYSSNDADHHPCYELRGQLTNVWCVAASTQMLLNFYRYSYDQVRIASELGLGTLTNPNGLPYSRDGDVVTVIENLTSNALDATLQSSPTWGFYVNEIKANRPLLSFIPGHARSVAGYTRTLIFLLNQIPFRGLLVYDPWPPTTGVITRWENFNTQTYRIAFSAVLKQI